MMKKLYCKYLITYNIIILLYREKIKLEDILTIQYNLIDEKISLHKTSVKIQKLKQNMNKEVVWVMKDDSFINLVYFLVLENNYNNNFPKSLNMNNSNIINNAVNIKKSSNKNINNNINTNLARINKMNSFNNNNNLRNINNNSMNNQQMVKSINSTKKRSDKDLVNGGTFISDNKKRSNILKTNPYNRVNDKLNNINLNNTTKNKINNRQIYNNNNVYNNIINKKNQANIIKMGKKELNNPNNNYTLTQNTTNNSTGLNYLNNINTDIMNIEKNEKNINKTNNNIYHGTNNNNNNNNLISNNNINNNNKKKMIINTNINNTKIKSSLYNTISPKTKYLPQNLLINRNEISDFSQTNNTENYSNLNNSDFFSVINNKNDQLNLTVNTIDLNNNQEVQYKILSNNNKIYDPNNIFSKEYISKLNYNEYEYDTFCQAIIKTGLSEKKMSLSKYSENFPAPCGHELCSKLPALEPNVLDFYQNPQKSHNADIKQAATSHLIFPLGIKLCVDQEYHNQELINEPLINTIYNEKGDIYYIASLTYYKKITLKNYNKIFNINPIDVYNKFKKEEKNKNNNINTNINTNINNSAKAKLNNININNLNNNLNNEINYNKNINNLNKNQKYDKNGNVNQINNTVENKSIEIFEEKNEMLKFSPNDIIYIPECLTLVSRFPFFNQLSKCLKIIIYMRRQIINGDNNEKITNDISLFINHIINQIPVGDSKLNILFYTPLNIEPITLYNPYIYNFGNFTCPNIFSILNIDNIITIFLLVLLEQKIIFVDTSHLMLSAVTFFFINLIYPLSWVNTYEPLLCLSTIRYIQSITPFIMGGNESLILYAYYKKYIIYNENLDNIDKSNIVFVSLTNNLISCDCYNLITNKKGQSRKFILKYLGIPDLPKKFEKKLYNHLDDIEKMDKLKYMNEKLKVFFCRIMVYILDDYKDYLLFSLDKPIFNKDDYLKNRKEDQQSFYKELLSTQLFTQFIFFENELYKNKKLNGKKLKQKKMTYGAIHDGIYKDDSFFMKNKNIIEELRIMIKKKKKEKIKKPLLSAKKFVKNIGQMIIGTSENKKKGNAKEEKSSKNIVKTNISVIKLKKEKNKKINNVLLMPYFIEEPNMELNDIEKYDYIQNNLNSIITLDNQLNQINNYKNKYIFDFNQKFDLKNIKDDNVRYFIGYINKKYDQDASTNTFDISKLDLSSSEILAKVLRKSNKINSKKENNLIINNVIDEEEEKKYVESKEKINNWFTNLYLTSNKKKLSNIINITEELRIEKNIRYFSKLISHNYRTLFDIKENNQHFLSNESFMELLLKIKMILTNVTYNEFKICKLVTLSCFKYYTILEEQKSRKFYLYNKYNELYIPCNLWMDNIFWKTWFDEDISYIEKQMNLSNDNDLSFDLNKSNQEDNELYEYNEENNNYSIEFRLLLKLNKVMNWLKLGEEFIKKVIFDDLATNYLNQSEINLFNDQCYL